MLGVLLPDLRIGLKFELSFSS